jgi:hypothetical protein
MTLRTYGTRFLAGLAAAMLAAPAQGIQLDFQVDVAKALEGNPVGAVVGSGIPAGSGNTGAIDPTGVGLEAISFQPSASGPGAFLSLQIGNEIFDETDDIESVCCNDVPAIEFSNGAFLSLDYVLLFEMVGGDPVAKQYDESDLAQDTSAFTNTPHYWMDFTENQDFSIALVTGFEVIFDSEEGANFLVPVFGQGTLVEGTVFLPEPSRWAMAFAAVLAISALRRRDAGGTTGAPPGLRPSGARRET